MIPMQDHHALVAELDKRQHEKVSDTVWRFHHGQDPHDAAKLHVMLREAGYYPAGPDPNVKDAWAAFRLNKADRPLVQIGVHRKTDPNNPETHFTDIILY